MGTVNKYSRITTLGALPTSDVSQHQEVPEKPKVRHQKELAFYKFYL
jgi:hypothetical protein